MRQTLDICATCHHDAGQGTEALIAAEEAVERCDELIALHQGQYLHLLARVTGTYARIRSRSEPTEALAATERMVGLTHAAARKEPLLYAPPLVEALTAHALVLEAAGDTRRARRLARRALSVSRRTAPDAVIETRQRLAGLLPNRSGRA